MKSLAQIRAANALTASHYPDIGSGQNKGNALSGFPQIIQHNGLLAACASALELNANDRLKNTGEFAIIFALTLHLSSNGVSIYTPENPLSAAPTTSDGWLSHRSSLLAFVEFLSQDEAASLRRATAESLAYLAYLKRFVA